MLHKNKTFLKILRIELDDLTGDIEMLIERYVERYKDGELSDYVCKENIALMKNELSAVEAYLHEVKKVHPEKYNDLDTLIEALKLIFQKIVKEKCLAHSIIRFVEKKLDKVKIYVDHT